MTTSLTRANRLLALLIGAGCVAVGAVLTLRPFESLRVLVLLVAASMIVTGVADVLEARQARDRLSVAVGFGWVAAGIGVLAWPGATITVITVFVGVSMLVSGALMVWAAARGRREDRVTAVLSGAASLVFGVLALSWPDVTVLVVAVVFGARTVLIGLVLVFAALRGRAPASRAQRRAGRSMRWWARAGRAARAVGALVVALLLLSVSVAFHRGHPRVDAFYDAPKQVPSTPGQLLRSEPFDKAVPATAQAWRILYTTTRADGVPALSSGVVLVSRTAPAGPRPVIAWAHGTTGYARPCAPSVLADPFGSGALPALGEIVANGWVLVATDYIGLGTSGPHTYMIGQGEGRAVLDAVRAARQLREVTLSDKTVVWGHSQGGGSALWTGGIAAAYAPDVPLAGVAAMAPASDLTGFVHTLERMPGGSIFASFVLTAYAAVYPDVHLEDYIRPEVRSIVKKAASRCLGEPSLLVSIATTLPLGRSIYTISAADGALGARLRENIPTGLIAAPLLIAQGDTDQIIEPTMQRQYVRQRCVAGQQLEYRTYPGLDHIALVNAGSPFIPDLISWTRDRIDGRPGRDTCANL